MSEGFHPKMRISSPSALPLGVAGEEEVLELEFREPLELETLLGKLNGNSVEGLRFEKANFLAPGEKKAILVSSIYEMTVPEGHRSEIEKRIENLLASETFPVEKHNGKTVNLRAFIREIRFDLSSGVLNVELLTLQGPEAGIREFLCALGLEKEMFRSIFPSRKKCVLK